MVQTLRPLTIAELLDRTFVHYRRHFVLFVSIAALPSVFQLAFQLATVFVRPGEGDALPTMALMLGAFLVYLVTGTLAHGAAVVALSQLLLGRETSLGEAFNSIRPRVGELIVIGMNVGVRVMLGALLLIVPGVLLALRYSLAIPVAVLEDTPVADSLTRSATLTKGDRGRILLVYVLLGVLIVIGSMMVPGVTLLAAAILSPAFRAGHPPVWMQVALQFGNFVSQSVVGPLMPIALTLVYYDERVRKEAFDLAHMMQQLDGAVSRTPSAA